MERPTEGARGGAPWRCPLTVIHGWFPWRGPHEGGPMEGSLGGFPWAVPMEGSRGGFPWVGPVGSRSKPLHDRAHAAVGGASPAAAAKS